MIGKVGTVKIKDTAWVEVEMLAHAYTAYKKTHIQCLCSVVSLMQNLCPGELRDRCAVLLLSHCLVLAM